MTALFSFSLTLKLPVYTVSVTGGTTWYGFGRDQSPVNPYWRDFCFGLVYLSTVHRRKYEEAIDAQLHQIFGSSKQTGIRVLRRDGQAVDLADIDSKPTGIDRDTLN
jgi:hypothetical protein